MSRAGQALLPRTFYLLAESFDYDPSPSSLGADAT